MDVCANIADPVIAPSGKVFSAIGLRRLAEALCVDKGSVLWRRYTCHESERRENKTGAERAGTAAS